MPCPARPIRCRPRVTDFGDSTWITRSTAPMSMPSSSEEVATRQGSWPDFSISSTRVRSSWESEPWWARAISTCSSGSPVSSWRALAASSWPPCSVAGSSPSPSPLASSFRRLARRSEARRLLTKMIVEVCSWTSSQQLRVDRRPDRAHVGARLDFARLRGPVLVRIGGRARDRPCPRPARRSRCRGLCASPRRRSCISVSARRGTERSAPAAAGWPTGRSAGCRAAESGRTRRNLPAVVPRGHPSRPAPAAR